VSRAKAAESIEMPFGADSCGSKELYVLDGDQDRKNPFASARCDKSVMRTFAKLYFCFTLTVNFALVEAKSVQKSILWTLVASTNAKLNVGVKQK